MKFKRLEDVHAEVTAAQVEAQVGWKAGRDSATKGALFSRGRWLAFQVRSIRGIVEPLYEGETRRWDGSMKDLKTAERHAQHFGTIVSGSIFGGYDFATSVKAYRDFDYDALVAEWSVDIYAEA